LTDVRGLGYTCTAMHESARRQQDGHLLHKLRIELGLTSRELARAADVSQSTLLAAEHGSIPYPGTQKRIAAALDRALRREAATNGEPMPARLTQLDLWPLPEDQVEAVA
jgi:transcriptional regulator with XRE-family HTH domain